MFERKTAFVPIQSSYDLVRLSGVQNLVNDLNCSDGTFSLRLSIDDLLVSAGIQMGEPIQQDGGIVQLDIVGYDPQGFSQMRQNIFSAADTSDAVNVQAYIKNLNNGDTLFNAGNCIPIEFKGLTSNGVNVIDRYDKINLSIQYFDGSTFQPLTIKDKTCSGAVALPLRKKSLSELAVYIPALPGTLILRASITTPTQFARNVYMPSSGSDTQFQISTGPPSLDLTFQNLGRNPRKLFVDACYYLNSTTSSNGQIVNITSTKGININQCHGFAILTQITSGTAALVRATTSSENSVSFNATLGALSKSLKVEKIVELSAHIEPMMTSRPEYSDPDFPNRFYVLPYDSNGLRQCFPIKVYFDGDKSDLPDSWPSISMLKLKAKSSGVYWDFNTSDCISAWAPSPSIQNPFWKTNTQLKTSKDNRIYTVLYAKAPPATLSSFETLQLEIGGKTVGASVEVDIVTHSILSNVVNPTLKPWIESGPSAGSGDQTNFLSNIASTQENLLMLRRSGSSNCYFISLALKKWDITSSSPISINFDANDTVQIISNSGIDFFPGSTCSGSPTKTFAPASDPDISFYINPNYSAKTISFQLKSGQYLGTTYVAPVDLGQ
jgi:hypothetical protein